MWLTLLIAGAIDYKKSIIPNSIVFIIFALSVFNHISALERFAGLLLPALPLFYFALRFENINGGDIKFLSALGFYLGLTNLAYVLIPTSVFAVAWSFVKKEKSVPLAFVTFLGYTILKLIEWW